jgi:hypothetical protein
MGSPTLNELVADAEVQFHNALGPSFRVASREVIAESYYRGGFRLVFANASSQVQVFYGDLELEVTANGCQLFGPAVHQGFSGNMFSREHLKQHLSGIAASSLAQLRHAG